MNRVGKKVATAYRVACTKLLLCVERHATSLLLMFGVVLLAGGLVDLSAAQGGGPGLTRKTAASPFTQRRQEGAP